MPDTLTPKKNPLVDAQRLQRFAEDPQVMTMLTKGPASGPDEPAVTENSPTEVTDAGSTRYQAEEVYFPVTINLPGRTTTGIPPTTNTPPLSEADKRKRMINYGLILLIVLIGLLVLMSHMKKTA